MKTEGFGVWGSKLRSLFDRYKFVLVVILAGVVLLLLPSFGGEKRDGGAVESSQESGSDPFQVEELERKLEQALAQIDGVGEVRVVLTLQSGPRRILAQDSQSTVEDGGGGNQCSDFSRLRRRGNGDFTAAFAPIPGGSCGMLGRRRADGPASSGGGGFRVNGTWRGQDISL